MREALVAWAGDCRLRGEVELGEGRLSDQVNERDLLTFFGATLEALGDGHEVAMDELEVERRELHLIEVEGRRGDPVRRLRTVEEPIVLEVGPFIVTGSLHRSPSSPALASLQRWQRFVPVTGAQIEVVEGTRPAIVREVVLVNRDHIQKWHPLAAVPVWPGDTPDGSVPAGADAAEASTGPSADATATTIADLAPLTVPDAGALATTDEGGSGRDVPAT
jgi:hypothetical protein